MHFSGPVRQTLKRSLVQGARRPMQIPLHPLAFARSASPFQTSRALSTLSSPSTSSNKQSLDYHDDVDHPLVLRRKEEGNDLVWDNPIHHAVYDLSKIQTIEKTHHLPTKMHERVALLAVKALRTGFDIISGYRGPGGAMTERDWLNRCLFLESVAGVPGMVGGMLRHLRSLRLLRRDYGWIHTLLEEAENERMHLLIFMNMKQPGYFFRALVVGAQGVFFNLFFATYLVSPRTCHRFVGYLEEEAVHTYTCLVQDMQDGHLKEWDNKQAPLIARNYYKLPENAQVLDMIKCIRADEANHRDVNHTFADLDQTCGVSPFLGKH